MTELSTIHQRLFLSRVTKFSSHVCAVLYYERERERDDGFHREISIGDRLLVVQYERGGL